jgi:hypothetical protein
VIHSKAGVTLYINGKALPLVSCTHFGNIREKYNVKGVFGSKSSKLMLSSVVFIEGSLEPAAVGNLFEKDSVETCVFKMPETQALPCPASVSLDDGKWQIEQIQLANNLHRTSPLKMVLGKISAIPQFLNLLKTSMQPVALSGICDCITQNSVNYKIFIDNGGWNFLAALLVKHEEFLSPESLEFLISAVLNKSRFHSKLKKMLVVKTEKIPAFSPDRVEGLSVVSELLAALPAKQVTGMLDCLTKLVHLEENAKVFLSADVGGLLIVFELLNSLVKDSSNEFLILTLFEKVLP